MKPGKVGPRDVAEALRLLHGPLGVRGSGRVRYGAAMALWRSGLLSEPQLEVYREAAAFDGRDPAPILRERGLPPVPDAPDDAAAALLALAEAAEPYLVGLDHPGAAEVRAGLAARQGAPVLRSVASQNPVMMRWLDPALAELATTHPVLAGAISRAAPHLGWQSYTSYPPAEIGPEFATAHAYATIMGGAGPFVAGDFEYGLFLMAPGLVYRDHCHPAPELYAPLTGPHGWRFGPDSPVHVLPAHVPVWNPPEWPHLTRVGVTPFLAFYVWTADVAAPARILPATDWDALAALMI